MSSRTRAWAIAVSAVALVGAAAPAPAQEDEAPRRLLIAVGSWAFGDGTTTAVFSDGHVLRVVRAGHGPRPGEDRVEAGRLDARALARVRRIVDEAPARGMRFVDPGAILADGGAWVRFRDDDGGWVQLSLPVANESPHNRRVVAAVEELKQAVLGVVEPGLAPLSGGGVLVNVVDRGAADADARADRRTVASADELPPPVAEALDGPGVDWGPHDPDAVPGAGALTSDGPEVVDAFVLDDRVYEVVLTRVPGD